MLLYRQVTVGLLQARRPLGWEFQIGPSPDMVLFHAKFNFSIPCEQEVLIKVCIQLL